jgi:hypothetical protein
MKILPACHKGTKGTKYFLSDVSVLVGNKKGNPTKARRAQNIFLVILAAWWEIKKEIPQRHKGHKIFS